MNELEEKKMFKPNAMRLEHDSDFAQTEKK